MTVHEFAERVLFSSSLEEKLALPCGDLADTGVKKAFATPPGPGRPRELMLASSDAEKAEFPREHELKTDAARGRLLHFFANHELLATELMALALLKFPDAPPAFRRGLLHILTQEQNHTQWYIDQMKRYGVTFGDHPVNGFFWRAVAGMESPLDYVTRLPLTFEQANLDFSLHYRDIFNAAGDDEAGRLFQTIHDDEISHVGYGLRWFRRWKEPGEEEFEAFSRKLTFPLSAARAKGREPLDLAGRRRAGLTDEFIRSLELFSRSKGRTPCVYWFNPTAESELAEGSVDATTQTLAQDLDLVPVFLARREDIVLVTRPPAVGHLRALQDAGVELPEIEVLTEKREVAVGSLTRERKLGGLRPWSWSPEADRLLRPLMPLVGGAAQGLGWEEPQRELYSKCFGARVLAELGDAAAGRVCRTMDEVTAAVEHWKAEGYGESIVKCPFTQAGRSRRRFNGPNWNVPERQWLEARLREQGGVVVEPWLERLADFSVQLEAEPGGALRIKGFTRLETDARGRFEACVAAAKFQFLFTGEVARFFNGDGRGPWLRRLYEEQILPLLAPRLAEKRFHGALGIDALVFRDRDGRPALRSVVEVNPRFTMGRLTLELLRLAAPNTTVRFSIMHTILARRAGFDSIQAWAGAETAAHPLVVVTQGAQRIIQCGSLFLNDPAAASQFIGVARFIGHAQDRRRR